jgi:hypothetical protein
MPITESEINKAVLKQKNGKSAGTDTLIAEIFKSSLDLLMPFLKELYNQIFNSGEYPKSWGEGIIVAIHKSGSVDDAKNYRGITLINILGKIYSQILLNRLTEWSENNNKINDYQFGFQKGKSTTDCIFLLHAIIANVQHSKKKLYCAFIDFEKAFDKLNRNHLIQKLINENLSSKIVKSIKSMYNVVKACVRYKNSKSEFMDSYIGIKQGDPGSSLMFLFFLNDIVQNIDGNIDGIFTVDELKLFNIFFADDGILFSTSPESLQSMLNDLQHYCQTWNLKINAAKTKIVIFEKGRHTRYNFYINDTVLEIVNSFKYLGIHFFKNNNWNMTQKRIAQHASFSLHNTFIVFNQLSLNTSDKCKLFDSLVGSILNYNAEIWGSHPAKNIENIHTKFCRKILGVKSSTNLDCLYGELGRLPMSIMRKIHMIRYWIKLLKCNENTILYKVYSLLRRDADQNNSYNNTNWASHIKSILNAIGMTNLWINQDTMDIQLLPIKSRIVEIYFQSWYGKINNSTRLQSYCLMKHNHNFEKYLDYIKENKYRTALTRFRLSSHNLAIETGRYNMVDRAERICLNCNMNVIENEFHFLLICPKYSDLRKKYIKKYYYQWPTIQKLENLFAADSKLTQTKIAKYIYHATKLRI